MKQKSTIDKLDGLIDRIESVEFYEAQGYFTTKDAAIKFGIDDATAFDKLRKLEVRGHVEAKLARSSKCARTKVWKVL